MMTNEERDKIRVKDRPMACLAEIREWIAERRTGKFTAAQQITAMHRMSGWGASVLLCVLIDLIEGEAT